ncbi:MAG: hypothetical protein QHH75_15305 [Bacillota bacterium]|nr:hypothetical protein [Bacillota bacterium]
MRTFQLEHYLDVLEHKTRAVMHAAVVRQLPEIYSRAKAALLQENPEGYRELCRILLLHREYSPEQVAAALEQALAMGFPTAAAVRQLILNQQFGWERCLKILPGCGVRFWEQVLVLRSALVGYSLSLSLMRVRGSKGGAV